MLHEKLIKNAFHSTLSFFEGENFNEARKMEIKKRIRESRILNLAT